MTLSPESIELRGVEVHNLKHLDLDIPRHKLVVICGVSGSGKTSLALDTLYAEGQRRYIESFSAHTRQFLEQLDKPSAERIDGIPPAISVTRKTTTRNSRATVGTTTETADYLRLLFAKIGRIYCPGCHCQVTRDSPASSAERLSTMATGARFMVGFSKSVEHTSYLPQVFDELREDGFVRAMLGTQTVDLSKKTSLDLIEDDETNLELLVIVDRFKNGRTSEQRLRDSLETAFAKGAGQCLALVESATADFRDQDGRKWQRIGFSQSLACQLCEREFPVPEPRLYSFNSPLGACAECEGFGRVIDIDMDLVVPNRDKSLREGAIAPWNSPAYAHELDELLALADDFDIPVDVPFKELSESQITRIQTGIPEREFDGLNGFFERLKKHKQKLPLRVFLSRWKSYRSCAACQGNRLTDDALATQIGGKHIAAISQLQIDDALTFFQSLKLNAWEQTVSRTMLEQIVSRLGYLQAVGLGYLSLDRTLRTLSGGESQRVALTSALGSSLVNMLYVLDEPSVGLHPRDVERLIAAVQNLRARGNSVIVVEHEEAMLRAADQLIEIGPGAGRSGGTLVFQGSLDEMQSYKESLTNDYLSGRRGMSLPNSRRTATRGRIKLVGARGNNLKNLSVEFPLGVMCLITGVSGSGKSSLVQDTLYPALCQRKQKESHPSLPFDDVLGDGQIDDIVLVDQSPIGRSPRSNPVTYIKAFDEIRKVFAETIEARTHNYTAGHFSFNVDGGRCSKCQGEGFIEIDMQFLADVYMKCTQCQGQRYRKEILQVTYRGRTIADVLKMTAREAFSFFRGQPKVQAKLNRLIEVGLDYLQLGQPANTLSGGESQRLKLAAHMSSKSHNRTLFILDEPTTGLHFFDVVNLIDCFDALLAVGHSLIVVEHNLQLMRAADYIIDLGPGAADEGGEVVVTGTPEQVVQCDRSVTSRFLAESLTTAQDYTAAIDENLTE